MRAVKDGPATSLVKQEDHWSYMYEDLVQRPQWDHMGAIPGKMECATLEGSIRWVMLTWGKRAFRLPIRQSKEFEKLLRLPTPFIPHTFVSFAFLSLSLVFQGVSWSLRIPFINRSMSARKSGSGLIRTALR